eukprot:CAMPEP_0170146744 /NCGR_PEP_ID=MMETSP0033_2-20121228/31656_1 /TAXON_ID=195969 /ORGANISM="Dolichomastix tenuilepis, Strain CCMP3274" /LENGTH=115 /DNA_ID=CAMNT_0010383501 /DNA_START=118 /DNA_END=465 /DNA_ORIENTATION=-
MSGPAPLGLCSCLPVAAVRGALGSRRGRDASVPASTPRCQKYVSGLASLASLSLVVSSPLVLVLPTCSIGTLGASVCGFKSGKKLGTLGRGSSFPARAVVAALLPRGLAPAPALR